MPMDENVDYFLNEKMYSFLFFNDSKYLNSEAILPIVAFYSSGQKIFYFSVLKRSLQIVIIMERNASELLMNEKHCKWSSETANKCPSFLLNSKMKPIRNL